jgi:zinc transport system substrate-binding protein
MILIIARMILMLLATRSYAIAAALTATSLLAGCGAMSDSDDGNGRRIAAAFYPLAYAAERVAGSSYEVVNLTQPGQEPHDLELGVRETAAITDADLVIVERGLQPAVDTTVEENAEGAVLDVANVVDLQAMVEHEGEEPEEGGLDPHFWQDPLLMAKVGDAIADKLSDLDPDHADQYAANAASLRTDLEALDQEYSSGLADCERDVVVVNHDAFEYLGRYGLRLEPILGLSPDAEPTPADLARLQELIRDDGITTVFSETLVSDKTAKTLATDLGITATVLDPIEGLSDDTADEDYLSLMRRNLAALREANNCT